MALSKQAIRVKNFGQWAYEEKDASQADIYPGMLVEPASATTIRRHTVEGGFGLCQIVIEDALQGKEVSEAYANGAVVRTMIFRPGEEFLGLVEPNQIIAAGERLISSGNGKFKSATDSGLTVLNNVAEALEACDTTGSYATMPGTLCHMRAL